MEQAGTPLNCGQCGTPNAPGARFCSNCGSSLASGIRTITQSELPSSQPNTFYSDTPDNPYPVTGGTFNQPYGLPLTPPPPPPLNSPYGSPPPDSPYGSPPPPTDTTTTPPPPDKPNRRAFLIGAGAVVGLGAIGAGVYLLTKPAPPSPPPVIPTLTVNFTYSTEKDAWIQAVIGDFNKSNTQIGNKLIQIQGTSLGSGDAVTRILSGQLKTAAWSPASDLELNQLLNGWQKKYGNQNIVPTSGDMTPKDLVLSPLVFAAWKERSDLLKAKYGTIDWPSVHDALQLSDWSSIPGGQAAWGNVKFGQTRPDTSNSGLLSITLLAYTFYGKIANPPSHVLSVDKIQNTDFSNYFSQVEENVTKFGNSSKPFIEEVILQGTSAYDIITTYENLVLTEQKSAQQSQQPLIPSYPGLNIVSNHPFVIFTNASQEEQLAAKKFRDFLLDVPQQRKALLAGFRPVNANVSLHDPISGNLFNDTSFGFQVPAQLPPQVPAPHGDVTDELINRWKLKYGNS